MWKLLKKFFEVPEPPVSEKEEHMRYDLSNPEDVEAYLKHNFKPSHNITEMFESLGELKTFMAMYHHVALDRIQNQEHQCFAVIIKHLIKAIVPSFDAQKAYEYHKMDYDAVYDDMVAGVNRANAWFLDKMRGTKGMMYNDLKVFNTDGTVTYLQDINSYEVCEYDHAQLIRLILSEQVYYRHRHLTPFGGHSRLDTVEDHEWRDCYRYAYKHYVETQALHSHKISYGETSIHFEGVGDKYREYLRHHEPALKRLIQLCVRSHNETEMRHPIIENNVGSICYWITDKPNFFFKHNVSLEKDDIPDDVSSKFFVYTYNVGEQQHSLLLTKDDGYKFEQAIDRAKSRLMRKDSDERNE